MEPERNLFDPTSVASPSPVDPVETEETLVTDSRAGVTPAEMVEQKLVSLLKNTPYSRLHASTRHRAPR
jgi:hypothetical protein